MVVMMLPRKFGRYELLERIAVGGTAEIYRAVLTSRDGFRKTVAIKTLLPQWVGNEELARLLIDEARVLCHLTHRSIVQVFELGREGTVPFIAMDYVDGIDCARLLNYMMKGGAPLGIGLVLHIVASVLAALAFAHERKDESGEPLRIVHRDISPSNILISRDGEVRITDFGIAKGSHRTELTDAGQMRGKYAYMSPEQARGEPIDCRSDIFSLGTIMCELVFAMRLFTGSDAEVLRAVGEARFDLPDLSSIPSDVSSMIERSLAPVRELRYQSAHAMLSDAKGAMLSAGGLAAPLDLARYLGENFPEEAAAPGHDENDDVERTRPTAVLSTSCDAGPPWRAAPRLRGFVFRSLRTAALLLISFGLFATHPADGSVGTGTLHHGEVVAQNMKRDPVTEAVPEAVREEKRSEAPSPSRLFVGARPWGLASVRGYVGSRETPISGLRVSPGRHIITVLHPPSGRRVSRAITVGKGQIKKCLADFREGPVMKCM